MPCETVQPILGVEMANSPMRYLRYSILTLMIPVCLGGWGNAEGPSKQFHLETGLFAVDYDSSSEAFLRVHRIGLDNPAFRISCAPGKGFYPLEGDSIKEIRAINDKDQNGVRIFSIRDWGELQTDILLPQGVPGLIRWRVEAMVKKPVEFPDTDFDCLFEEANPSVKDSASGNPLYGAWTPAPSPLLYFFYEGMNASVFFYSDFTSLNDYFDLTYTWPDFNVNLDNILQPTTGKPLSASGMNGFGYYRPASTRKVPAGSKFVLADSYCLFGDTIPRDDVMLCRRFLDNLAAIYPMMTKPETEYTDWTETASRVIRDVQRPECWTDPVMGRRHLHPYVNQRSAAVTSLNTELEILLPLRVFNRRHPDLGSRGLEKSILGNIRQYYHPENMALIGWLAAKPPNPCYLSSWRVGMDLYSLGEVVLQKDSGLEDAFLGATEGIQEVGKNLKYKFPRFYEHNTRQGVKASQVGLGGDWLDYEVGGSIAYSLLQRYELTGDSEYLESAKEAVKSIAGEGLNLGHTLQNAAAGAAAGAWLYNLTGEKHFLDLSYIAAANVLRRAWFWECNIGGARYYKNFFGIVFSSNAPHIAPMEYSESFMLLHNYYLRAHGSLPDSLEILLPECQKWAATISKYFYPPNLPPELVSPGPAGWPNDPSLYLALEDMDCINILGTSGQPVYMSGIAIKLANSTTVETAGRYRLFCEYPIVESGWNEEESAAHFRIGGLPQYSALARFEFLDGLDNWGTPVSCFLRTGGRWTLAEDVTRLDIRTLQMTIPGGADVRIAAGTEPLHRFVKDLITSMAKKCDPTWKDELEDIAQTFPNDIDKTDELVPWYAQAGRVMKDSGESETEAGKMISAAWNRIAAALFGVYLEFSFDSEECSKTDTVHATARFSNTGDRPVEPIGVRYEVPSGWTPQAASDSPLPVRIDPASLNNVWQSEFQVDDAASVGRSNAAVAVRYRVGNTEASIKAFDSCELVSPLTFALNGPAFRYGEPGETIGFETQLTNYCRGSRAIDWKIEIPSGWKYSMDGSSTFAAGFESPDKVTFNVLVPKNTREADYPVKITGESSSGKVELNCLVEVVSNTSRFVETGDDSSGWRTTGHFTPAAARDPAVWSKDGVMYVGYGDPVVEREVCINLDEYPYLSLSVVSQGPWHLWFNDGRRKSQMGIRLEQGSSGLGLYHYNVARSTGLRGVVKFKLIINTEGTENVIGFDWIAFAEAPLYKQPDLARKEIE